MLNNVPKHVAFSTRQVVLRHPNSIECAVYRKVVLREETIDGQPSSMGGEPTSGGMGEITSEDEADFDYMDMGDAKLLFAGGQYPGMSTNERDDNLAPQPAVEAQIVSLAEPDTEDYFIPDKYDVVILMPTSELAVQYEIVDVIGNVNVPPYTRRYLLNVRDLIVQIEDQLE